MENIYARDSFHAVSKKHETGLNFFWYGFVLFTVFYTLSTTQSTYVSAAMCQAVQILGLGLVIMGAVQLMSFKFDNQYLQMVFTVYLLYSISTVLRGAEYDFNSLKKMFLDVSFGALPYITPLVILLPRKIGFYKKIFTSLIIMGGFFLLFTVLFYNVLHDPDRLNLLSLGMIENFAGLLALPAGFILLTYLYHAGEKDLLGLGKKNIFALLVMMVALFFAIYRARRGLIFMCVSTLAFIGMIYLISYKKKALIIMLSVAFIAAASIFFAGRKTPAIFNFVLERGDEDTRTGVEEYMYADMSTTDWIIGKGINGEYYCPIVENVNDASGYRDNIETGYLQMILKGGVVSVVLLLLILVPAVYKGLFGSRNILSKAAAIWILLWIVYEYPIIGVGFTMHYILVWISVGICFSKKITSMSDMSIKYYLQNKKQLTVKI